MGRVYDRQAFRALERERCAVHDLVGGECAGPIHRHHVQPLSADGDPWGRTVEVCERHHPMLEALARRVHRVREWKRCPHNHVTADSRRRCEERLNGVRIPA